MIFIAGLSGLILLGGVVLFQYVKFKGRFTPILLYHFFAESSSMNYLEVSLESFRRQMDYLYKRGYTVIPLRFIIEKDISISKKSVVITVDDGDMSFFDKGFPILSHYGFPMTIFVVPSALNNRTLYTGNYKRLVASWDHLQKYSLRYPKLNVGSHTLTHVNLCECSENQLSQELSLSREILKEKLSRSIDFLAYPYGAWNSNIFPFVIKKAVSTFL